MMPDCAVIILASGRSSRFGLENKLMTNLGGQPLIGHCLAATAAYQSVFCIAADNAKSLITYLASKGVTVIANADPDAGQGASLAFGARQVIAEGFSKAIVLLADMPFIDEKHLERLSQAAQDDRAVLSQVEDGLMLPPAHFSGQALNRLTQLSGDKGARSLFAKDEILIVKLERNAAIDIDTRDDLAMVESRLMRVDQDD